MYEYAHSVHTVKEEPGPSVPTGTIGTGHRLRSFGPAVRPGQLRRKEPGTLHCGYPLPAVSDASFAALTFSAIFFVVDPFAAVPLFLAITKGDSAEKRRRAAFKATYGKHAMRTCVKGEKPDERAEIKNAAKQCKAAKADDPVAFAAAWGDGKNAFGKCVSGTVRAEDKADVKEFKNAAKECKAARKDDPAAFAAAWGEGRNAYGKCVSATVRAGDES